MIRRLSALCAIALLGALAFAAQSYATSYPVTVTITGTGGGTVVDSLGRINCPGDCYEASYPAGPLSLTATANSYSLLDSWSGACAFAGRSPTCATTVAGNTNIGASFLAVSTSPGSTTTHKKCKKKKHRAASARKKCKKRK